MIITKERFYKNVMVCHAVCGFACVRRGAIQAIAVTVRLPFTAVMLVMIVSLYLGLRHELKFGYNNTNKIY